MRVRVKVWWWWGGGVQKERENTGLWFTYPGSRNTRHIFENKENINQSTSPQAPTGAQININAVSESWLAGWCRGTPKHNHGTGTRHRMLSAINRAYPSCSNWDPVWPSGTAGMRNGTSVRYRFGSPFSSKNVVVCGHSCVLWLWFKQNFIHSS